MKVRLPNGQKYDGVWNNGNLQEAFSIQKKPQNQPIDQLQ